uniref:Calmodulin-lysine N-methyltransferase n=1 Tax=Chaetoceros debilis TaxID=122233 RepID=A0A7S3QA28_9STRA|mmetsp:Transcript_26895/g.41175  ORF Transcript_26895/g.41175 Transcript_26895/m.41175 type:complete len:307 (-) Transcript_26895:217-1137(-)
MITIKSEETQWNDAQIRFGPYNSTMTKHSSEHESGSANENHGSDKVEESYGASADFKYDKETFTFVFDYPKDDDRSLKDEKISINLQGFQSKSNITYCSTGLTMWPAAKNLSDHLVKNPDSIRGKRILELGSGLGLCGLVAHHLTNSNAIIHMTDGDTDTLGLLQENIASNQLSRTDSAICSGENDSTGNESNNVLPDSALSCCQLLWSRENSALFLEKRAGGQKFDVILASDIIYAMSVVGPMWETIDTLLTRDGIFLFAFARRQVAVTMVDVLEAGKLAGFVYEECEETDLSSDLFVYIFRKAN